MRNLTPRRTFSEMDHVLESMERAFDTLWNPATNQNPAHPIPIDVYETANHLNVRASVPGIKPEELEISFEKNVVTIRGEQTANYEASDTKVYRREHRYGQFTRSIRIPEGYQLDQSEATFANGVVTIQIPRVEPVQPEIKRIPVKTVSDVIPAESAE